MHIHGLNINFFLKAMPCIVLDTRPGILNQECRRREEVHTTHKYNSVSQILLKGSDENIKKYSNL